VRKLTNQLEREKKRADDTEATTSAQYKKKVHRVWALMWELEFACGCACVRARAPPLRSLSPPPPPVPFAPAPHRVRRGLCPVLDGPRAVRRVCADDGADGEQRHSERGEGAHAGRSQAPVHGQPRACDGRDTGPPFPALAPNACSLLPLPHPDTRPPSRARWLDACVVRQVGSCARCEFVLCAYLTACWRAGVLAGVWAAQTLREDAKRFERKMRDQLDTVEALEDAKCVPRGA
jgi:hypothetical protein